MENEFWPSRDKDRKDLKAMVSWVHLMLVLVLLSISGLMESLS